MKNRLKNYYHLAKPGIIYGNLLTTVAGFFFAIGLQGREHGIAGNFHFTLAGLHIFLAVVIGTALVIGSACVFNNYTDRALDAQMSRTRERALVRGDIPTKNALIYGVVLGAVGFATLILWTNAITVDLELIGLVFYVILYGLSKRASVHGVLVGSVSGAVPIAAGYCAVAGRFDLAALVLFLILVVWQMPHFYAIALYRADEYAAAGIPVLPLRKGIRRTKIEMLVYVVAFVAVMLSLWVLGYVGWAYFWVMTVVGVGWIGLGVKGFWVKNDDSAAIARWAKRMFLYSLITIVVFSVIIGLGVIC